MNTHDAYKERLSALLDDELDGAERDETLAHLANCEACQIYFAELNAMRDAFGNMEPEPVPEGFAEGVMARLHAESAQKKAKKRRMPWRTWGTLAACAAVVVLAVTVLPDVLFRMGGAAKSDSAAPESYMMNTATAAGSDASESDADEPQEAEMLWAAPTDEPAAALGDNKAASTETCEDADGAPTATNGAEAAEYVPNEAPVLTLYGANAGAWLLANGEWDEEYEAYWVEEDALCALDEGMVLYYEYSEVDQVYGAQLVRAAETEAAP